MVRYLACLRFELLTTVLLLALPLASSSTLIGNLFHLENRGELALVIALCCLIAWQIMVMVLLVLERAPAQLGLPTVRIPAWVTAWRVPLFTVLAGPSVATVVMLADRADWAGRLTELGLGLGLAFAVLWLTTLAQQVLTSPGPSMELLLDPRLWVPRRIREHPGIELKDIQTYKRAHGADIKRKGKGEK